MCELCEKAKSSPYIAQINEWFERDKKRLLETKSRAKSNSLLSNSCFSSVNWPIKITFPLFEVRTAYTVPTNYFQNFFVDGERQRNDWAHDCTRAVSFIGNRLLLLSKFISSQYADEWLSHYYLILFEKNEYSIEFREPSHINIHTKDCEKLVQNLVTGEQVTKKFTFNFMHEPTDHASVSREQAMSSGKIKEIYGRSSTGQATGDATSRMALQDFDGYILTVPHFAPHPYLLNDYKNMGSPTRFDFENAAVPLYFKSHSQNTAKV